MIFYFFIQVYFFKIFWLLISLYYPKARFLMIWYQCTRFFLKNGKKVSLGTHSLNNSLFLVRCNGFQAIFQQKCYKTFKNFAFQYIFKPLGGCYINLKKVLLKFYKKTVHRNKTRSHEFLISAKIWQIGFFTFLKHSIISKTSCSIILTDTYVLVYSINKKINL